MALQGLTAYWNYLPPELAGVLAIGSIGKSHLLKALRTGFELLPNSGNKANFLSNTLKSILLSAWSEDPLDGNLAREIIGIDPDGNWLSRQELTALKWTADNFHTPENLGYFQRLAAKRDTGKIFSFLSRQREKEPDNNFWLKNLITTCLFEKNQEQAQALISGLDTDNPCLAKQAGDLLFFLGDKDKALAAYQGMGDLFGQDYRLMMLGMAGSDPDLVAQSLGMAPWRTNLALRLNDVATGADKGLEKPAGKTAILLYSWNKANDLDATLESLFNSDIGGGHVFCLDNGSTDATSQVVAAWADKFGKDRFTPITLPVNVGAAAARNWLMHFPQVAEYEFTAYLDDDIVLDKDWLCKLGAGVTAYPDSGVWGCKVVDHSDKSRIQCADYHLTEPETGWETLMDLTRPDPNPFGFSRLHIETLDMGWFDYMRPCVSVTGCCHLFKTVRLLDCGDFSLALSPSQYDDFERDLRMNAKGLVACYNGHLAVAHKKSTGAACRTDQAQDGNAIGNKYKMQVMHPLDEIKKSHDRDLGTLKSDLMNKLNILEHKS